MLAASESYFSKEHFLKSKGTASPEMSELVVHCLELVSQLGLSGLPFRFKGGNSLLLLLENPERFSSDVDIATGASREEVIELVTRIKGPFNRLEVRQHKTKPWLPMISFNLFFESFWQKPADSFVMLDVVLEEAPYPGILKRVKCGEIYQSGVEVEIPSVSGLIADKLLTLGPATLGIPLGKKKEAQRLKHVFDLASLARADWTPELVAEAIGGCIKQESALQRADYSFEAIKADTLEFLNQASAARTHEIESPPEPDAPLNDHYRHEIAVGFAPFCDFLFKTKYSWERLIEDAGLVASVLDSLDPRMIKF